MGLPIVCHLLQVTVVTGLEADFPLYLILSPCYTLSQRQAARYLWGVGFVRRK